MNRTIEQISESAHSDATSASIARPKQGDRFHCEKCGMELEITTACRCKDPHLVRFECCGQNMVEV